MSRWLHRGLQELGAAFLGEAHFNKDWSIFVLDPKPKPYT